ncbi:MAG: caspase family protein [Microcystaceae cyanobacterium]
MKLTTFKTLTSLTLVGITATLLGMGMAQAQRTSLTVRDRSGRQIINYNESHALVIWVKDYKHWGSLNSVENEANDVKAALERQGFKVTMVGNPNGKTLRDSIKAFIDNHGYKPNNRLLIFFAGHGHTRQETKGYLVPVDAPDPIVDEQGFLRTALPMRQLVTWAELMEAKHALFVFDSCFSGAVFKRSSSVSPSDAYIRDVMNKPVRQFLTAGDADEEVPAKSVFTPLFIQALDGKADLYKDGYVTGSELGLFLRQHLIDYTTEQTPQFGTIRDPYLDQGDIVFRVPSPSPTPTPTVRNPSPSPTPETTTIINPSPSPTPETATIRNPSPSPTSETINVVNSSPSPTPETATVISPSPSPTPLPQVSPSIGKNGEQIIALANPNYVNDGIITGISGSNALLTPDQKYLITYGYKVRIWDYQTGKLVRTLKGHSSWVRSVAISGDGQTVVSGSRDNTVKVWELGTGKLVRTLAGHSRPVNSVAISEDGKTIVSGSGDNTVKVWELGTGKLLRTLKGHSDSVKSVAISGDGRTLVSGSDDNTVKVWELGTGRLIRTLEGHYTDIESVAISEDGKTLVSGSDDYTVKVWELGTGKLLRTLEGHSSSVSSVAISEDGKTVISGSWDKTVKVWELGTGKLLRTLEGHSYSVKSVAISRDGQTIVSGSEDKTVKVWNLANGKLLRTLKGHSYNVNRVAISRDGQTLVSGSDDYTVKVWELATGKLLRTLEGHSSSVNSVAISRDGQTVVSGSLDTDIRVWKLN